MKTSDRLDKAAYELSKGRNWAELAQAECPKEGVTHEILAHHIVKINIAIDTIQEEAAMLRRNGE